MTDQLTPEEVAAVQEAFSLFDKDGDGQISSREVAAVLRTLGYNPAELEVKDLLQEFDPSDNGVIEFTTFLTLMSKVTRSGDSEDEVDEAFRVFDKDGNGMISVAELRHIMTNMGEKLTEDEVEDMLQTAEADTQGEINYKDFIKLMLSI